VRLHKAQLQFLQSKSLFKCFCGGIGSGKTWCGSYDLLRRAKAGRLYLVAAPTFQMLQDSTFRIFLSVADGLGILEHKYVRHGAPPAVKLRSGCEVIFRSSDNPDSLRGPNLSGVWLDEGALMAAETFGIVVGRLREGGEMGWLSCTSTPRGKTNWVHEVFNTGRPNTELVRCKTQDNPFLPREFTSTVGQQYTSQQRLQELEGEFVDGEGGLFRRDWFGVVDPAALPRMVRKVRGWDLAGSDARKAADPDFTAGVLVAADGQGTCYVLDVKRLRSSPQAVEQAVRQTAELDGRETLIWMEREPGSAGVSLCDHYARHVLNGYAFHDERCSGSKATRAQPLAAAAERGLIKLLAGHWVKDFLDELEIFPMGNHDDQVDATALAFAKLQNKRQLWMHIADGSPPPARESNGSRFTASGKPLVDVRPDALGWKPYKGTL
jgi:predicted phage terminase large subunit-like protein